jgi:hypothetical protein
VVLVDANVLIYAHRNDAPDHASYREWLTRTLNGDQAYGMCDLVFSSFLRIVTHPGIFNRPTPTKTALEFLEPIRTRPNCVLLSPGARHWEIFCRLCKEADAKGNLVPDAYLAALAIESGSEWITTDRDYARFSGLRWRHPLRPK